MISWNLLVLVRTVSKFEVLPIIFSIFHRNWKIIGQCLQTTSPTYSFPLNCIENGIYCRLFTYNILYFVEYIILSISASSFPSTALHNLYLKFLLLLSLLTILMLPLPFVIVTIHIFLAGFPTADEQP